MDQFLHHKTACQEKFMDWWFNRQNSTGLLKTAVAIIIPAVLFTESEYFEKELQWGLKVNRISIRLFGRFSE